MSAYLEKFTDSDATFLLDALRHNKTPLEIDAQELAKHRNVGPRTIGERFVIIRKRYGLKVNVTGSRKGTASIDTLDTSSPGAFEPNHLVTPKKRKNGSNGDALGSEKKLRSPATPSESSKVTKDRSGSSIKQITMGEFIKGAGDSDDALTVEQLLLEYSKASPIHSD